MKEIRYNLTDIDDSQFAIFPENYVEGKEVAVFAKMNVASNNDGASLKFDSRLELKQDDKLFIVSEIACKFAVTKESWEDVDEKKKMLPSGFIRHLASIAIGTQRGIIIARTKDSSIHKFILPPIDLTEVVKDDFVKDISEI